MALQYSVFVPAGLSEAAHERYGFNDFKLKGGALRAEEEVEAIVALVRQGFGVSIVPQLANLQWSRDRSLMIVPLPRVSVQRHVGLLERRRHGRERFTAAIKSYFVRPPLRGSP